MKLMVLLLGLMALATARSATKKRLLVRPLGPAPQVIDDFTCQECHVRYHRCVELAFVFGLPACEQICAKRVKQQRGDCHDCDQQTYFGNYTYTKPEVPFPRPKHDKLKLL